jgi:GTP-binding protein EngB required for normal cell division
MNSSLLLPHPNQHLEASVAGRRAELERCVLDAAELPGIDPGTARWLQEKLADEVFNLVVAGQFKRGKSTIINALLGESLLPSGVVPLTSVVTVIRSGGARLATVEFRTGLKQKIELSALHDYVTERDNPGNAKGVERVTIDHPSPLLANGVRLVDTPGIGSVYAHNTDETRKYLPQADAVLFVASVDQPVGRAELDFLAGIREYAGKIFCLLNKVDYLRPEELRESLEFSTEAIRGALGASIPVFATSARMALEGKLSGNVGDVTRSGFPELEQALRRFMAEEKTNAWLASIARSLLRVLKQARFTLDLEAKVLTQPLERIEANLALFREEKQKAERARADYQVLLQADARALMKDNIEPRLEEFKGAQQASIGSSVDRWFADAQDLSSRKLQSALEERLVAELRGAYDGWLAREDAEISRAFQSLCARFWSNMQQTVDDLMRRSSELFSVEFDRVGAGAHWTAESAFYYKFWYEPTSLKILSSSAILALPKRLAGALIIRRTKAMALDLIEVQAGRIRHDLDERLKKSVRDAQGEIVSQIEATVAGIETAIDAGIAARGRSVEHSASRSRELADLRQALAALEGRLARLSAGRADRATP